MRAFRRHNAAPREASPVIAGRCGMLASAAALLGLATLTVPGLRAAGLPASAPDMQRPALVTPVAVFGPDDRVAVPARLDWVAQRIGILFNNRARTVCTAFCVADNVIATAAHCFAKGQSGVAARFADFNFARNYDRSRTFVRLEGADTGAAAQNVTTGDFKLRVRPPIDAAFDWALARVPRNTCPADALKVAPANLDVLIAEAAAGNIFQVSYHRDWAQWRPSYSKPCKIARDFDQITWPAIAPDFMKAEHMVLHTCDTGGASSGSPILMQTPGGPVVVAINVGTYVQSRTLPDGPQAAARQRSDTIANTAVNAFAFNERLDILRQASILGSGAPMRQLQELLVQRGHYAARVDGAYGPSLKSAIEAYEQTASMPVTGLATETLRQRLLQDGTHKPAAQPQTPTSGSGVVPQR
ncbi:MAG: peptidoglycan-binding protein [Hyphomicrobiaceae bacterium]